MIIMETFEEIFEKLAKTEDRTILWNNFLDYCIAINTINLNEDPKIKEEDAKNYADLLEAWLNQLDKSLEEQPYHDMLGEFYEELVTSQSKSKNMGQFYTPDSVTNLMTELTKDKEGLCNDPTCGSARLLLAAHCRNHGKVICIGQDLDEISCKMAVLNFWSHGVVGSILHMDSLENKFYKAYRVNKYLYTSIPIPHIEVVGYQDAFDFIGVDNTVQEYSNVQTKLV